MLSKEEYDYSKKKFENGYVSRMYKRGFIHHKMKFESKYGLRRALKRLKDLDLITSVKPKIGYSYLVLTDKCLILYLKWNIKYMVDTFIDTPKELMDINNYVMVKSYNEKVNNIKKENSLSGNGHGLS